MKKTSFLIFTIFIFTSCSENPTLMSYSDFPVIDIVNNKGKFKTVYCSDYFLSIDYIPLETNENSFIDSQPFIISANDSLLIISSVTSVRIFPPKKDLLVFNHSGKFLNQIGKYEQGPGEYANFNNYFINNSHSIVSIVEPFKSIHEYDFDGKFIRSIPTPRAMDGSSIWPLSYAEDSLFIGRISYYNKCGFVYCLFDRNSEIVKIL